MSPHGSSLGWLDGLTWRGEASSDCAYCDGLQLPVDSAPNNFAKVVRVHWEPFGSFPIVLLELKVGSCSLCIAEVIRHERADGQAQGVDGQKYATPHVESYYRCAGSLCSTRLGRSVGVRGCMFNSMEFIARRYPYIGGNKPNHDVELRDIGLRGGFRRRATAGPERM
jgi:hypothetical protein